MKAIEILKHKWIQGNVVYDNDTEKHIRYLKYDDELIHEAIKELEELENRSCSNCKYLCNITKECEQIDCPCFGLIINIDELCVFCCNKWENKQ